MIHSYFSSENFCEKRMIFLDTSNPFADATAEVTGQASKPKSRPESLKQKPGGTRQELDKVASDMREKLEKNKDAIVSVLGGVDPDKIMDQESLDELADAMDLPKMGPMEVRALQRALSNKGQTVAADGVIGTQTLAALGKLADLPSPPKEEASVAGARSALDSEVKISPNPSFLTWKPSLSPDSPPVQTPAPVAPNSPSTDIPTTPPLTGMEKLRADEARMDFLEQSVKRAEGKTYEAKMKLRNVEGPTKIIDQHLTDLTSEYNKIRTYHDSLMDSDPSKLEAKARMVDLENKMLPVIADLSVATGKLSALKAIYRQAVEEENLARAALKQEQELDEAQRAAGVRRTRWQLLNDAMGS